jgi:multiple sugar transport system substrate-binding protein
MMFDQGLIASLGLKAPTHDMTWAQVGELALEITRAAKRPGFFGLFDGGRYEPALEVWLRQRGKALYTDDGKLAFDVNDIGEWLAFWHDLRKRGAIASAEVAALDMGELDTSLLTVGKTAMVFAHSNQLVGFQALVKSKLGMTMYPSGGTGAKYGQYLKPSMLLSISARTRHPEAAVKLVDFYVANREAGMILGVERGVPASAAVRKAVEPTLDELGNAMASYVAFVSDKVSDLPAPPPQGAGEIQTVLRRVNEQIGFGRLSVADGAKQFIAEANAVLARG